MHALGTTIHRDEIFAFRWLAVRFGFQPRFRADNQARLCNSVKTKGC